MSLQDEDIEKMVDWVITKKHSRIDFHYDKLNLPPALLRLEEEQPRLYGILMSRAYGMSVRQLADSNEVTPVRIYQLEYQGLHWLRRFILCQTAF